MRCLVTGIAGFAGVHLTRELVNDGASVHGYGIEPKLPRSLDDVRDRVEFTSGDIRDQDSLRETLERVHPDMLFHLAALPHVDRSRDLRIETLDVNVMGSTAVLQAAAAHDPPPRMLLVSSGQVYGVAPESAMPLKESRSADPISPYTASKLCTEIIAKQMWKDDGLPVIIVRPFNYVGPGQQPGFVVADFARQVARVEAKLIDPVVRVGNLAAQRDFTDVRDMVRGFKLAATRGKPGATYNLASGKAVSVQQILDLLIDRSIVPIQVDQDPGRFRPNDVPLVLGDATRASVDLGWAPVIPLAQTLDDTLSYWRAQVAQESMADTDL